MRFVPPPHLALALALAGPAAAQDLVTATLEGRSALPAATFSAPPEEAPREVVLSGRFLDPLARADEPFVVP